MKEFSFALKEDMELLWNAVRRHRTIDDESERACLSRIIRVIDIIGWGGRFYGYENPITKPLSLMTDDELLAVPNLGTKTLKVLRQLKAGIVISDINPQPWFEAAF